MAKFKHYSQDRHMDAHTTHWLNGFICEFDGLEKAKTETITRKNGKIITIIANNMKDIKTKLKEIERDNKIWQVAEIKIYGAKYKNKPKITLAGSTFNFETYTITFSSNARPCVIGTSSVVFEDIAGGKSIGYDLNPSLQDEVTLNIHLL